MIDRNLDALTCVRLGADTWVGPYTKAWCRVLVIFVFCVGSVAAQIPDVVVKTTVDRTAIFVGDRATFTIELTCKRGVDILADDLSGDKLKLEGLDFVSSDNSRQSGRDGTTVYQFRYVVTTYRVDAPALTIGPFAVRYAAVRPGQRLEEAAPAGEVQIPRVSIAFRSALPDDADILGLRDDRPASVRRAMLANLQPLGIGLVIVSIVPSALAAAAVVRRRRAHLERTPRRSARTVRHEERSALEAVRAIDVNSIEGRREAFTRLETLVRAHLRDVCGVPGPSLTVPEIAPALSAHGTRMPVELVTSVLTACQAARYGPPHATPSAEDCRETVDRVEQLLAVR
jgi:hypothetical protein